MPTISAFLWALNFAQMAICHDYDLTEPQVILEGETSK